MAVEQEKANADPGTTGAAELAQQAQQEFQARQARQAAQSAAPQQHQVNTGKFEFNKIGYSFDKKLKEFKRLLDDYNTGGATPEQEIALMKAASDYIGKYSTGRKAKHQGRTKMMEDVLYQLTMKGGTRGKTDANIERISGKVEGAPRPEEGQGKDMEKNKKALFAMRGKQALGNIRGLYDAKGPYSKAMQMIAADVMSRQDKTSVFHATDDSSDAKRIYTSDGQDPEEYHYEVNGRVGRSPEDSLGTILHEFTHVAGGETFDNSNLFLTYEPEKKGEDTRNEMHRRRQKMMLLQGLAEKDRQGLQMSGEEFGKYVGGRAEYGSGRKTEGKYMLDQKNDVIKKLLKLDAKKAGKTLPQDINYDTVRKNLREERPDLAEALESGNISKVTDNQASGARFARLRDEWKKLNDFEQIYAVNNERINKANEAFLLKNDLSKKGLSRDEKASIKAQLKEIAKEFGVNINKIPDPEKMIQSKGTDTMVEYDPVINQMLAQYEHAGGDRDSQYYRELKAEALRSHVNRRVAALKRQRRSS